MLPIIAGIVSNLINQGLPKLADEVIEKGVEAVEKKIGIELKPEGQATPEDNARLQEAGMKHELALAELDEKSRQRATDMQMEVMKHGDPVAKNFIYLYAWFWGIGGMAYLAAISFIRVEPENRDFVNIVLGFILGTALAGIFQFFYGSSKSSQDKNAMIKGK